MRKLGVLDLFSGIGGFSLAGHLHGFETVAFCEYDENARKVLEKRFPGVPIYKDVRKLYRFADECPPCDCCGEPFCELCGEHFADCECIGCSEFDNEIRGTIDVICGGFPCQPFSVAGEQRGADDDRHLWPEMLRLIKVLRPRWVIGENVAGFVSMALDDVSADLERAGYRVRTVMVPAVAKDAYHRRDRVWIIADANSPTDGEQYEHEAESQPDYSQGTLHGISDAPGE